MTEPTVVLSVRGDARLGIAPDLAVLSCTLRCEAAARDVSVTDAARVLDAVLDELRGLGGEPITAGARPALGWLAHAVRSREVIKHDRPGEVIRTERYVASVEVRVVVRDFTLLKPVERSLANHAAVDLGWVTWAVDDDNAGWRQVRADAIRAALQKGRDYADALGGVVVRIEQVADSGLLGGDRQHGGHEQGRLLRGAAAMSGGESDAPSLDPVPQELQAIIEARLVATVAPLT